MSLRLDWCSYAAARYAVEHWHYRRVMPVNKTARIGCWEDGAFIGAIVFSCGSAGANSYGKRFGLTTLEVAELSRVALRHHVTPVTRIISIAVRMLRRAMPGLRLLVSYADPEQGHVGGIYQGGNWTYVGRSASDTAYVDRAGRRWHSRTVSESGWKKHCGVMARCPKPSEMRAVVVTPKYKYLMGLDDSLRVAIELLRLPYPKRERSAEIGTAVPTAGGGVIPTRSLQDVQETVAS